MLPFIMWRQRPCRWLRLQPASALRFTRATRNPMWSSATITAIVARASDPQTFDYARTSALGPVSLHGDKFENECPLIFAWDYAARGHVGRPRVLRNSATIGINNTATT